MSSVSLPTGDRAKGQSVKGESVDKAKRKTVKQDTPYGSDERRKKAQEESATHSQSHGPQLGAGFDWRDAQLNLQRAADGVFRGVAGFFDAIGGGVMQALGQNPQAPAAQGAKKAASSAGGKGQAVDAKKKGAQPSK